MFFFSFTTVTTISDKFTSKAWSGSDKINTGTYPHSSQKLSNSDHINNGTDPHYSKKRTIVWGGGGGVQMKQVNNGTDPHVSQKLTVVVLIKRITERIHISHRSLVVPIK